VFSDPERCSVDPTQCQRTSLPYRQGGNPNLKPEVSKQGTLGILLQPTRNSAIYADYWQVALEDRIRNLTPAFQIANYAAFKENFIRDANGNVQYIQAGWVNAAESKTKGLDFGGRYSFGGFGGRVETKLDGTYMISHKEQASKVAPLQEFVGNWSTGTLYLRWRLNGSVAYTKGAWNTTASVRWSSGYQDEDRTPYTANQPVTRDISDYTTVNLFTSYRGIKGLTLTGGIVNLFDKAPPFTWHNVDNVVGAGWDPRVADPRGRTLSFTANYSF
jgi:iron complex outermembrane recepter protein